MKLKLVKLVSFIILSALLITACGNPPKPDPNNEWNRPLPEYPVIDGSSSTEVMHMAIRACLTDRHLWLEHSQTYAALERLIPNNDNPADVILAVKYYDETLENARERGADLVITPIAKEGFVFILNKDNPVDSLTQQELKDIYSGKITNWKQLGGNDEEIIPYTRNWNSGSQTAMEDFMDGVETVGKEDNILQGMMTLLTQVQETSNGIGYNILSWATYQNLDDMNLKTVKVDKIKPDSKTLADGSYPLMVYTYSYYNRGNEKGKNLTDWLLSKQGQEVITSAEYVGIDGLMPPDNPEDFPDLTKDETDSAIKVEEYYGYDGLDKYLALYSMLIPDEELTAKYAEGKEKLVTVLRTVEIYNYNEESTVNRFIVLTRDKGGVFEVINEGELTRELRLISSLP